MAAIFKIQNGSYAGVGANINIGLQIPQTTLFPKIYRFANLHSF
jgi:hypothetical protein